jgi:hypothetical protein
MRLLEGDCLEERAKGGKSRIEHQTFSIDGVFKYFGAR